MSGLAQLTAVGVQSEFLSGNPQISFWKSSFKRHTNFSQQVEEVTMEGNPGNNRMTGIRINKKGDLLSYIYLTTFSGAANAEVQWNDVIDHIDVLVGGSIVDTIDNNFARLIAPQTLAPQMSRTNEGPARLNDAGTDSYIYPLKFWFCENWSSALPLCALQYSDVEIHIYWGSNIGGRRYQAHANFIYLDEQERTAMASETRDYIMTQVQKQVVSASKRVSLNFNHPVKFLASTASNLCDSGATSNLVKLIVNGNDVGKARNAVPHFTKVPQYYNCPNWTTAKENELFVYPFCLDTSKMQPTGALNFSRIDNTELNCTDNVDGDVYAVSYNVFRVQNGLGATLFAN